MRNHLKLGIFSLYSPSTITISSCKLTSAESFTSKHRSKILGICMGFAMIVTSFSPYILQFEQDLDIHPSSIVILFSMVSLIILKFSLSESFECTTYAHDPYWIVTSGISEESGVFFYFTPGFFCAINNIL